MVNADPLRTPTFTYFANDDFFLQTTNPSCGGNPCVAPGFAWNHGDIQQEIGNTWAGIVGPGVSAHGVDSKTWTDHTNLRPTIMALTGLKDDYVTDGRVLTEGLTTKATPAALRTSTAHRLATLYEQLNASFGQFGTDTLAASTKATAGDDATYASVSAQIAKLTAQRTAVAGKIKSALARAAGGTKIDERSAKGWLSDGAAILKSAAALPH
jgi:hypothetical protein